MTTYQPAKRGFLPDFSKYLEKDYPIEEAYKCKPLIDKLSKLLSILPTMANPVRELKESGVCRKIEKLGTGPSKERTFIDKCKFSLGPIYYLAFGNNPYRVVIGIDSSTRRVYFFALDPKHVVRKG